jgi:SAM-dependent methyltransferase
VILDLGTGDGRAVLVRAAADPRALVIGVDPVAAAMAESSRRGARSGNVLFVRASAELPPVELIGGVHELTVLFPWGSLLHGVLGLPGSEAAADGMAGLLRAGGRLISLVSVTERDHSVGLTGLDEASIARIARAHGMRGLRLCAARPAAAGELRASGSTWARRLGATAGLRPVWRLEFERG